MIGYSILTTSPKKLDKVFNDCTIVPYLYFENP